MYSSKLKHLAGRDTVDFWRIFSKTKWSALIMVWSCGVPLLRCVYFSVTLATVTSPTMAVFFFFCFLLPLFYHRKPRSLVQGDGLALPRFLTFCSSTSTFHALLPSTLSYRHILILEHPQRCHVCSPNDDREREGHRPWARKLSHMFMIIADIHFRILK